MIMTRDKIFKLIERNSGESIEESSKNGIMAHSVDVDGLIDDIQKALNVDLGDVSHCGWCKGEGWVNDGMRTSPCNACGGKQTVR